MPPAWRRLISAQGAAAGLQAADMLVICRHASSVPRLHFCSGRLPAAACSGQLHWVQLHGCVLLQDLPGDGGVHAAENPEVENASVEATSAVRGASTSGCLLP
jgi:hypothetical protein